MSLNSWQEHTLVDLQLCVFIAVVMDRNSSVWKEKHITANEEIYMKATWN